jgi:hypothetical protein
MLLRSPDDERARVIIASEVQMLGTGCEVLRERVHVCSVLLGVTIGDARGNGCRGVRTWRESIIRVARYRGPTFQQRGVGVVRGRGLDSGTRCGVLFVSCQAPG